MRKTGLVLFLIILSAMSLSLVYADVPTVTDLEITTTTDGGTVSVTIRHSGPTNNHYVSKVEIKIGENVEEFTLDPQSTVTFTEEYTIPEDGVIEVRAFCNLHGWSAWVSSEPDSEEPVLIDEEPSGIPGFPLAAVGLGLAALMLRRDW
ncbi:MAG: desulfoferrodoxin family protein [Candidatus Bathyarchaeota archaeon]|nr:desulfoferrodoxin family protein [Candidatus Bathyarchaeota archaeon]